MEKFTGYVREPFYYETDQMGIIHHSNYIRWFEEARVALLVHLGFPYKKIEESG
ncbi:acyl-CoA thioesterase, partial [Escherichia coli]